LIASVEILFDFQLAGGAVQTGGEDKGQPVLFQSGSMENCELGISCGPSYRGINSSKPIPIQITKADFVVNIDFRKRD